MSVSVARSDATTFPRLLEKHVAIRGNQPAIREKDLGIWQTYSWSEVHEEVMAIAGGLAALGFVRGDSLAIIGDNRPRLYWSMMAAQCLGGVPVPLYQDAVAQEMVYVLLDANVRFALVEDQEQIDKLLEVMPQCATLTHLVYDDPRGLRNYPQPALMSYAQLTKLGREFNSKHPAYFHDQLAAGKPDDVAVMLYTSGTTGKPKGVSHTHAALIHTANVLVEFDGITEHDNLLCYLPMAWVGDFLYSYGQAYVTGLCLNCPESTDTVMQCLCEIGPTYYFAPPRVYENILTQVMIRIEDATPLKRRMFHYFMGVARRVGIKVLDGKKDISFVDRVLYGIGELLVYGPMKNVLGLSRIRVAYSGGEAIGPDLFNFYRSMGINLKQLYGMTETCVTVCMQKTGDVKLGTVGAPMPGVEVRVNEDGEVLVRSGGMMKEYHGQPEATKSVMNADGFFMTGDAGFFDTDGHLVIIDRAKDVGRLLDGSLFAPKYIENKLKFFPYIKEAVAFGDHRDRVTVMINIDVAALGDWAERRNLGYSGYADLAAKPEVYALIGECIGKVNVDLASDAKLATSQIMRFVILHKELDADDGELTRTRKVRRNIIAEKYAPIINALYSDVDHCEIEVAMKFEDGRSGVVRADLRIGVAKTLKPDAAAVLNRKAA